MDLFQEFRKQKVLEKIPSGPILLGVSGGADSVSLLHLVHRLRNERKWEAYVLHAQHSLRGKESLRDQHFVEQLCRQLKIKCFVRQCDVKKAQSKNKRLGIEEAARILRYRAFSDTATQLKAKAVLTAHTANDQTETFLLNLLRGTGPRGLCAILPQRFLSEVTRTSSKVSNDKVVLARPMLSFSREEILNYLKLQKLSFCVDSSNQSLKFRRNWVREELLPSLYKVQPKIFERISSLTQLFQRNMKWWTMELDSMRKRVLLIDGRLLDLDAFFKYDSFLRSMFLHQIFPQASYRQIDQKMSVLEREKKLRRRELFPLLGLIR